MEYPNDGSSQMRLISTRGEALYRLGDFHAAEFDFRAVLKAFGNDPSQALGLISAKANLALIRRALGEYEEARKLQSEVLEASTRLRGVEHPDTTGSEGQFMGHPCALWANTRKR